MSTHRGDSVKYSISMPAHMAEWIHEESTAGMECGNASLTIRRLLWPQYQEWLRRKDIAKIKKHVADGHPIP